MFWKGVESERRNSTLSWNEEH